MMIPTTAHPFTRHRLGVVVAAVVLLLAACSGTSNGSDSRSSSTPTAPSGAVGPAEFAAYLSANPDVPLINVHIPYEGHIVGTDDFVAFDEIGGWGGLPDDKDAPLAIYCRSGNMSATAAATLRKMGYRNIVELDGGMNAWSAAGNDLVDDNPSAS